MSEENKQELRVVNDLASSQVVFSDVVTVEATPETIFLNFLQKLPSNPGEENTAKLVTRVALSWPHFARIANLLNVVLQERRNDAKEAFMQFVFPKGNA